MDIRKLPFKLQWSLQTMFLLTAVVAVWVPYFQLQQKIEHIETKIKSMRQMARELIVDDTTMIAVVQKQKMWIDENRWEIYLPEGEYTMRLATREIDKDGYAPSVGETRIAAGKHFIELLQSKGSKGHDISIMLDDQPVIETHESLDWEHGHGSTGGGLYISCTQLSPDEPLVLFRRRFHDEIKPGQSTPPITPTEGLLIWIERAQDEAKENDKAANTTTPLDPTPSAPPAQTP